MALINVGTKESPRWVEESLAWGNSRQAPADHAAEKVATGSVVAGATEQPKVVRKDLANTQKPA